jgi:SHAQKYF class myb-like DNA-binding protein
MDISGSACAVAAVFPRAATCTSRFGESAHSSQLPTNRKANARMKATAKTSSGALTPQPRYWSEQEHLRFLQALELYGFKDVRSIAEHVATRTATQVRTHAQKYYLRLAREAAKLVLNFVNGDVQLSNDQIWEYFILSQQVDSQTGMRIPMVAIDAARDQFRSQSLLDVLQRTSVDSASSVDGKPGITTDQSAGYKEFERSVGRENETSRKKGRRRRSLDESATQRRTELFLVEEQGQSEEDDPKSASVPMSSTDGRDAPDELAVLLGTDSLDIPELASSDAYSPRSDGGRGRRSRSNSRGRSSARQKTAGDGSAGRRSRSAESQRDDAADGELKHPSPKQASQALESILKEDDLQEFEYGRTWSQDALFNPHATREPETTRLGYPAPVKGINPIPSELSLHTPTPSDDHRGYVPGQQASRAGAFATADIYRPMELDMDLLQRGLEAFAQDPQCEPRVKHYADLLQVQLHTRRLRGSPAGDSSGIESAPDTARESIPLWQRRSGPSSPLYFSSVLSDRHVNSFSPTPETASPMITATAAVTMPIDELDLVANPGGMGGLQPSAYPVNAPSLLPSQSALPDRSATLSPLVRSLTPRTLSIQRNGSTQSILQLLSGKPTDELPPMAWMFLSSINDTQEDRFLQMLQHVEHGAFRATDGEASTASAYPNAAPVARGKGDAPRDASPHSTDTDVMFIEHAPRTAPRDHTDDVSLQQSTRPLRRNERMSWGSLVRLPSNTSFLNLVDPNAVPEDLDRS